MSKKKHSSTTPDARLACVPAPAAPLKAPFLPAAVVLVVVIVAFAALTVVGIPQAAALTGLAGAGALGVRLAGHMARIAAGADRV